MTTSQPAKANYDVVIFDLDGTLIDSRIGIHSSIVHTLKEMGVPAVDQELLTQFIGPPLIDSFQSVCGMTETDAERAVAVYKDYFAVEGIKGFEVYEGVPEMLWLLRASGVRMAIATTKDEVFGREIALNADFMPFLEVVIGSDREGKMIRKPELIATALSALNIPRALRILREGGGPTSPHSSESMSRTPVRGRNPSGSTATPRIVMVGDHALDIHGAKANNIASIAVTYGFGNNEELKQSHPDHTANSVMELRNLLLGV
ncbi:MAG: HAD hydrolase-like protein [Dehalococcoidia bacterium]|nr:HAD hydrolase-like protein [Dehalococcoidia bacterium]